MTHLYKALFSWVKYQKNNNCIQIIYFKDKNGRLLCGFNYLLLVYHFIKKCVTRFLCIMHTILGWLPDTKLACYEDNVFRKHKSFHQ